MNRVFGAIKGAGVQVREIGAPAPIEPGALGTTAIVGVFRSGPLGRAILLSGVSEYRRIFGGLTRDSHAPLNAEHFCRMSQGAGALIALRVTDGSGVQASVPLYDRNVWRSVLEREQTQQLPALMGTAKAANVGRWGGRAAHYAGDITLSTAISGVTVDLGFATLKNKWAGAILRFPFDDAAFEGVVVSNTAAGVFTVQGGFSAAVVAGTDGRFSLDLANENEITGSPEFLGVEVADGGQGDETRFSVFAWRDGVQVKAWENMGLDSGGAAYWASSINDDADNYEVAATDAFTGDPLDALQRPANYAEIPAPGGIAANVVRLQTARFTRTGTGNAYLDTVNDLEYPANAVPCTFVLTFIDATTAAVVATLADGSTITLPTLTLGTEYDTGYDIFPVFTLRAGATANVAADTMTLRFRPLPPNLASLGGLLYAAAAASEGNVRLKYRIVSNTPDTVTVPPSVDLSAVLTAPTAPTVLGATNGPFSMTGSLTFIYRVGLNGAWSGPYTLTETLSGSNSAANVAADLNAQELARVSGVAADRLVVFAADGNKIRVTALQDFGGDAEIRIGNGTLNAVLGFTDATIVGGGDGKILRLQYQDPGFGGYDGIANLDDGDYEGALDPLTSPLNDLLTENLGLIKLAVPGASVAAQVAALVWAHASNSLAFLEIPASETTEAAAIAYYKANFQIGEEANYGPAVWPAQGKIADPYGGGGLYQTPMTGALLGVQARRAVQENGYHKAPAGREYGIGAIFKDLLTGSRVLDNEALNAFGLIEIRKRGAEVFPWGDRIPGSVQDGRSFLHQRATLSHVGRILLTSMDTLVWRAINEATFAAARARTFALFNPWYLSGWFDDADGSLFSDQVSIKCDASNNPPAERAAGNLHIDIGFGVVNTAERVIFSIGPKGLSEGV